MKNFIDVEIKHLVREEFPIGLDSKGFSSAYYLRYRFFGPDGEDSEMEFLFPSLSSCIIKLSQLLFNYYCLYHERTNID